MAIWRMSFRAGTNGEELWPICYRNRVAVIEYTPVDDIDLSRLPAHEPNDVWRQLAPSQAASLKRFVYEMDIGDTIYVKQGPKIVGKGTVSSRYKFDRKNRIVGADGTPWQHQRRVDWVPGFPEVNAKMGRQQVVTLVPLTDSDIEEIEKACKRCFADDFAIEGTRMEIRALSSQRNRSLRDKAFRMSNGVCSVCGRDYSTLLDGRGVRVLQVHHLNQLASSVEPTITKLSQLAVVCANCHLLIHLDHKNAMTIEELRELLRKDGFANAT